MPTKDAVDKVSRYRVVSRSLFRTKEGQVVKLVYATRTSRVFPLPLSAAQHIERGQVPTGLSDNLLGSLRRHEVLIPEEQDELAEVTHRFVSRAADLSRRHVILLPTSYCNMGCTYCGQSHERITLRGRHRDAVRTRVLAILNHPHTRSVRLDWFGAEPLMAYAVIRDLARSFVSVAERRRLDWRSVIVTNGALLDARKIRTLAAECRVTHAEITVDGPPRIHDAHRPLKSGQGSFWRIVTSIKEALADETTRTMTFGIRTNVDVHNEDYVEELLKLLAAQGFAHPRVRFSIKPVHSWGNDVSKLQVARDRFAAQQSRWFAMMRELGLHFELLPTEPAHVVCPAVTRGDELLTATGDIFSCTEQPLVAHLRNTAISHADYPESHRGGLRPIGEFDDWHLEVAEGGRSCASCPLYATCGGACPKLWRDGYVPCPSYKFNLQERLELIAAMNGLEKISEGVNHGE